MAKWLAKYTWAAFNTSGQPAQILSAWETLLMHLHVCVFSLNIFVVNYCHTIV